MYNDDYLVSVIIPNYCHSKFLDERIQSVLDQTYQNFELIILDDCSPDNGASRDVIEKYRDNPHVSHIVYNEKNSGSPFLQWRKGLEFARGKFVWVAESDDKCNPSFLEEILYKLKENSVFAFCKSKCFEESGEEWLYPTQKVYTSDFEISGHDFIVNHLINGNRVVNASSVVFRRDVAMQVNRIYESFSGCGDWLFWIELAENGHVCFINKELNYFRQHKSNTTSSNIISGKNFIEKYKIYDYLNKRGYLTGIKYHKFMLGNVDVIEKSHYLSNETRSDLLSLWDRFYMYRLILPIYRARRLKRKLSGK